MVSSTLPLLIRFILPFGNPFPCWRNDLPGGAAHLLSRSADSYGKVHIQELPRSEWDTLVKHAHVGYITWEEFEHNEVQLAMNSQAYAFAVF
ncbi:hypothetical protein KSZ_02300 [Dictyobacter formicarum]|uniref:Uncharacterized protein n=1 Tax=Dictyobacter formicarum TaxID=2778368 RepID=A0ABQ3V8V7_9CHLR|nr:hypothetical protein KSZ_02300 [Dictyobacter formicarum]